MNIDAWKFDNFRLLYFSNFNCVIILKKEKLKYVIVKMFQSERRRGKDFSKWEN